MARGKGGDSKSRRRSRPSRPANEPSKTDGKSGSDRSNDFMDTFVAEVIVIAKEVIVTAKEVIVIAKEVIVIAKGKKVDTLEICIFVEILNTILLNFESYRGGFTLLSRNLGRLNIALIALSLGIGFIMSSLPSGSDRFGFTVFMLIVLFGIIGIRRARWR